MYASLLLGQAPAMTFQYAPYTLLGGFGIEPSHTQRVESSYAKDAGSKTSEAADCTSTFQASRFGKYPSSPPKPSAQIQLNTGRQSLAWQPIP
jgi:hypothetical protein